MDKNGSNSANTSNEASSSNSRPEPPAPAAPAQYETHTNCATMGSKGLHSKEQSRIAEVERLNDDLSTDCPDSDSDNDMAMPCVSDTEDETTVDTEHRRQTMDKAIPGWTQWQAHIEGHCAPRSETSPPNIVTAYQRLRH